MNSHNFACSFCGLRRSENPSLQMLFTSSNPNLVICLHCIKKCESILLDSKDNPDKVIPFNPVNIVA